MARARALAPWRWDVAYVVPLDVKYAPVRGLAAKVLLLALAGLAAVVAVTLLGARSVGRTVRAVVEEAKRLRDAVDAGQLSVRGDAARIEGELSGQAEELAAMIGSFRLGRERHASG